jgi:hypothetical protein
MSNSFARDIPDNDKAERIYVAEMRGHTLAMMDCGCIVGKHSLADMRQAGVTGHKRALPMNMKFILGHRRSNWISLLRAARTTKTSNYKACQNTIESRTMVPRPALTERGAHFERWPKAREIFCSDYARPRQTNPDASRSSFAFLAWVASMPDKIRQALAEAARCERCAN